MSTPGLRLHEGWKAGATGWVIAEHGRYYETHWQLGAGFEAKVAAAMGEWMGRFDPARDYFLLAEDKDGPLGSISLDGSGPHAEREGARIRFFIMADRARGRGIGKALVAATMRFIEARGFERAFLTTFSGLDAARKLYEDEGFVLTHEEKDDSWGRTLIEQRFEWQRA
jgi:GNAT superfamily N-acetyltransferase